MGGGGRMTTILAAVSAYKEESRAWRCHSSATAPNVPLRHAGRRRSYRGEGPTARSEVGGETVGPIPASLRAPRANPFVDTERYVPL